MNFLAYREVPAGVSKIDLSPCSHDTGTICKRHEMVTDPVLPMVLSGLTMNFMLYEKDYGLVIARHYCRFNFQMKVVKSSL